MRFNPFSTSRTRVFKKVEVPGTGYIHLEVKKGIVPDERTEEVQKIESEISALDRDRLELLWSVIQISKREGEKRGISLSEAREQLFGGSMKAADSTGTEIVQASPIELVETKEELKSLLGDSAKDEQSDLLRKKLKRLIATNVMRSRLGWTVEAEPTKSGSVQINTTRPCVFGIFPGSKIRFGSTTVTVGGEGVMEWEDVIPVEKTTAKIEGLGFLLDGSGREFVGTDWTEEMTAELLIDPQIEAIYQFFQTEDAGGESEIQAVQEGADGETEEEAMGNSSQPSPAEAQPESLNGAISSSGSKPAAVKIGG